MATKKTNNQPKELSELSKELSEVTLELAKTRLDIKAGTQSNTNAHRALKTKRAQLLFKIHQLKTA